MVSRKEECPICKRKLRLKCFIYNRIKKQRICRQCNQRIGTNPFYTIKENNENVSKYSITKTEQRKLWVQMVKSGLSVSEANRRIWYLKFNLKKNKFKNSPKITMNEKFIEGLKNNVKNTK